ncbi:butyrophilin subfamily 1 member A1-like [Scleropages formosus]|uniref:butyrophilin subfamily 1 member A1-like n=1 Tax=Scleropages formosus TaxID=113540 RepID=UPI0010FA8968|nr:butyrophilin subfamily 1 member A1-like [Scleropages formosus]
MKISWSECLCFILLLLQLTTVSTLERFEVLGPAQPVVAVAGEDVVLPCYLKPNISAVDLHVEWFRVQINNPIVHLYWDHEDRNENQLPSYRGRTSLFPEELKKGNTSLKLYDVRSSDDGPYKCFVQSHEWQEDFWINLHIKAVGTQPVISNEGYEEGGISLVCESKGWYPQPQVVWMDSEGHSLPAGHTETHRDSMDLFTVRRRVIVQETENNRFTCQVLQEQFNEMKETVTEIPGEMFHRAHPWKVTFAVVFSLAAVCIIGCTVLIHRFVKLRRRRAQLKEQYGLITRRLFDVTLDPDTAHPQLVLSEDRKQVRHGVIWQDLPDNPERFKYRSVLGKEGFSSGRHYWEVQVGEKTEWTLGVVRESINRKGYFPLNTSSGLWALSLTGNEYWALTDPPVSLNLSVKPQKVGVYVDYEEGQVSFYSVEDKSHIYTFTGYKVTEKLYPYFWPGFRNSAPLIISPVIDVTLDPDTAHPELILSEDRKRVRHENTKQELPDNPERFKRRIKCPGKRRVFFWETLLGGADWEVGSTRLSLTPVSLRLSVKPQKVGVSVDYEEGQVFFYSVEDKSLIYTFTGYKFTEKLYPYFCPGFWNSAALIISPVIYTD